MILKKFCWYGIQRVAHKGGAFMDLYQISVGIIGVISVLFLLTQLIKTSVYTWESIPFDCEERCMLPRVFAICKHGCTAVSE